MVAENASIIREIFLRIAREPFSETSVDTAHPVICDSREYWVYCSSENLS